MEYHGERGPNCYRPTLLIVDTTNNGTPIAKTRIPIRDVPSTASKAPHTTMTTLAAKNGLMSVPRFSK